MSLNKAQEEFLKKFAEERKQWPKAELEAMLWQVKWQMQALPHQREPDDGE